MGLYHSRFIEALKNGSEDEVRQLYNNRKSVRDRIDPNTSLGPAHNDNSVLHYAALHAMEWLYRDLLTRGGKPDMRNGVARNCLHLVCSCVESNKREAERRARIVLLTIHEGLFGMDVEHVLRERDEDGNTALHLAASAGLQSCVEVLLENKADLYVTNKKEQTAADCASECKRSALATLIETRMVFTADDDGSSAHVVDPDHTHLMELAEAPSGMRDSDLRSMKDQLLIETSELLGVSLFTSEALLRHHGWSKEQLLEAWMENPTEVCEKAGVQLPTNLGTHNLDTPSVVSPPRGPPGEEVEGEEGGERECGVCVVTFVPDVEVPCGHVFCRDCWRHYLHQKIEAGDAHSIVCPEYGCFKLVPIEVIEGVVSRKMTQRYLQFDIKAFVESHPTIRWCPYPDCHRAVRITTPNDTPGDAQQPTTVHCGNEHYFCWSCSGEPHVPTSCEGWRKWLDHVQEMAPQIGDRTTSQLDDAASQRWLATRSKPCPKCRAPIEKTDGCNHMCCKKCKHDFCWVCLDEWKLHNTSTGGYFECNRYEVRRKADSQLVKRKEEVKFSKLNSTNLYLLHG
ncbi:Ankyrin repeat and IBR domain-containing protein 1 [Geodia barretti]|uniref:RBR-type E3 ubiquitin transferase n=1 Tax=Geodia barretti TaxID=519541 RepID=A0AA35SJ49_GEOBA|nr:Ankyrin repeat and IBR domain-containing protein 1 [Geodia barretti]